MKIINWELAKNPVNWLTVASMALVGLIFVSLFTAPYRVAAQPAQ